MCLNFIKNNYLKYFINFKFNFFLINKKYKEIIPFKSFFLFNYFNFSIILRIIKEK